MVELIRRCQMGDGIACWQFYLQYYLSKKFETLCKDLNVEKPLIVIEKPLYKDSAYNWGQIMGERELFNVLSDDFSNKLNISKETKVKVLLNIQKQVKVLMKEIEENIEELSASPQDIVEVSGTS